MALKMCIWANPTPMILEAFRKFFYEYCLNTYIRIKLKKIIYKITYTSTNYTS